MTKKSIHLPQFPNKILRQKSLDVTLPLQQEDIELAQKMIDHIDYSQDPEQEIYRAGVGVAAVQYGILKNMFYVNVPNRDGIKGFRDILINPKILGSSTAEIALEQGEGCLSVPEDTPNQGGHIARKSRIVVKAYSYFQKQEVTYKVSGYIAIVFQHELDHLQGKLFIDRRNAKSPWNLGKDVVLI